MSVARTYASWALALRIEDVPAPVVHAAKRHLLDGVGCAIAAARTGAAPYATAVLDDAPGADVIGLGRHASPPRAGLANGVLVHALDFDDTHAGALVHATAAVLPAAFAVGQASGASGREILTAAIAGYEIVTRLGAAVTHGFHARGFHATSVCGVFAAAIVAARLLGADEDHATSALGIAGSGAAGSLEFLESGSATKQLHPGLSAMNGIVAARLASAGAEGPATIFEGRYGLFRSYLGVPIEPAVLTDGLGQRWETARITIKPYPACQLVHASLDAMRALGPIEPDAIEELTFEIPDGVASIVGDKPRPRTAYEAKFSLEHCAAALLTDGVLGIDAFDEDAIARAAALAARIRWTDRPFAGAPADAPGIATVTLRDGTSRTGRVERSRGGPDDPLTDDELLEKFRANGGSDELAKQLLALDELDTFEGVLR